MDLRTASDIMLGCIDVAPGVQPHMHATHDLPGAARRVVLLYDLHFELHVFLESGRRTHAEILGIDLKADVDDLLELGQHGGSLFCNRHPRPERVVTKRSIVRAIAASASRESVASMIN